MMELLAPAGDWAALESALEAGVNAVYLGLRDLNARRRAKNFGVDEFARAIEAAHVRHARVYLTLNTDIAERELGEAARSLELARRCGADAVLVRDPALFALRPLYPGLEFHLSTQACAANSADAAAALALDMQRVVLARELSLKEIAAASSVPGMKTEVFVQGALCFSVSGRCLLSSWAGGRSGNRGACASPCRVPWTVDGESATTVLSMKDLCALPHVEGLRRAGVAALKIEGRLKSAEWVRRAVGIYHRALAGEDLSQLGLEAQALGDYTGREQTCGHLEGRHEGLTGVFGRPQGEGGSLRAASEKPVYDLVVSVAEKTISCRCAWADQVREWSLPKTAVRRVKKAISLKDILKRLEEESIQGLRLGHAEINEPDLLLPPRAANALVDRLSVELRLMRKKPERKIRLELPAPVREILAPTKLNPGNRLCLGDPSDRVRLAAAQVESFAALIPAGGALVEGLDASQVRQGPFVVALPSVFFEDDIPKIQALILACKKFGLPVEVNSLGGWHLAKEVGVAMEGGPGLSVLNSLAARRLMEMGLSSVTFSLEADKQQLEDMSAHCLLPCSIVVYGRPALMTTRVKIGFEGKVIEDRRGVRLRARKEGSVRVLRPTDPFDWRELKNPRIRAAHLVVDLVGSANAEGDWRSAPSKNRFFNYSRTLA